MKQLTINLQPARAPGLDVPEAVARLTRLAAGAWVTEGEDTGRYVNVSFQTGDLLGLWTSLREELQGIPGLAGAVIVVCEGEHGWDDYLLLHHFNPQEQLDHLG
jgi:hypothetical protein